VSTPSVAQDVDGILLCVSLLTFYCVMHRLYIA
jgi:hypothetical protein